MQSSGSRNSAAVCCSVYGKAEEYTLATMRPTEMMKAFAIPEIGPVAREVEEVILQMMKDAAT